jgi:hypothetical protein
MKIDHGTIGGVPLEETFTFDPEAGLALASVTDLSGNRTEYTYGNAGAFNVAGTPGPVEGRLRPR